VQKICRLEHSPETQSGFLKFRQLDSMADHKHTIADEKLVIVGDERQSMTLLTIMQKNEVFVEKRSGTASKT
jgi:hypothetical protein